MSRITSVLACALAVLLATSTHAQQGTVGPAPSGLKVLYAGKPDSPRMKEFVEFLEKHFAKVGTHDLETSFTDAAKEYDVVVIDWPPVYPRDANGKIDTSKMELSMPKPAIDPKISKPIVMIGAAGGTVINSQQVRNLALDWKCLCLENYAHNTNTSHPIFQGPLPVNVAWEMIDIPTDYYLYPGAKTINDQIRAWKVQQHSFPVADPGLVSTREVLENTADGESISGGTNGKGPTSVAIARHGNYLLWGFSASPSEMTDAARAAFINSVCYMSAFDGQTPQRGSYDYNRDPRKLFMSSVYQLRLVSDDYAQACVKGMKKMLGGAEMPPELAARIGDNPAGYFKSMGQKYADRALEKIPDDVKEKFANDHEQIIAYYADNYEYLHPEDKMGSYGVDEQIKQLGVSNQDIALVDRCIEMLASSDTSTLAAEILDRYVDHNAKSPAEWTTWLKENRDALKFDPSLQHFVVTDR